MSKERLEEMERMKLHAIEHDDIAMLKIIEQAERVEELERNLTKYRNGFELQLQINGSIKKKNKRYREAIDSMRLHAHYPELIKQIYEALEGEE